MDKHKQKTKTDREREKKNKQYRDWQTLTKTNWEIYAAGLNQRIGTVGKYTCSLFKSQYVENSIVVNIIRRMFCDPRACSIEWPSHGKWGSSAERSPLFSRNFMVGWLVGPGSWMMLKHFKITRLPSTTHLIIDWHEFRHDFCLASRTLKS